MRPLSHTRWRSGSWWEGIRGYDPESGQAAAKEEAVEEGGDYDYAWEGLSCVYSDPETSGCASLRQTDYHGAVSTTEEGIQIQPKTRVESGLFGGLISWVKHSGCWLPPTCYWLLCYWFASLLLPAGLWHFSDLNKNCWLAQAGGRRCPTPCLPERDHQSAENIDKVCAMREIGELGP